MRPILFDLNGIPIYAHGFFLNLALFICLFWLVYEARRRRWPKTESFPITLAAFVGGMIGARVSIVFFNGWETAPVVLNFFKLFDPRIGPGSILGAVLGAYIAGFFASQVIGKAGCACDAFAPAMALAMVIGRMGCFLSGEDGIGAPTNLPWGMWNGSYIEHPAPHDVGGDLRRSLDLGHVLGRVNRADVRGGGDLYPMGIPTYLASGI